MALTLKGFWRGDNNIPHLQNGVGTVGDMYYISTAGNQNLGNGYSPYITANSIFYTAALTWISQPVAYTVDISQIFDVIDTELNPLGSWDASTNTPYINNSVGSIGDIYYVAISGNVNLGSGADTYSTGRSILYIEAGIWIQLSVVYNTNLTQAYGISTPGTVNSVTSANSNLSIATPTTTPVITVVAAPKWQTARTLAGNSVDGSANVTFSNKFIVQGTSDSGLSNAQFMGSLSTGIVKNTTTMGILSIATAGSDYEVPLTFTTGLTRTVNTVTVNTSQSITILSNLTINGFIKTSAGTGALTIDTNTYITGNQSITLSGDISGTGTTTITTTIGVAKVLNSMLAGSIAASKLVGTDIITIGTLSAGSVPYSLVTGGPTALPPSGLAGGDLAGSYPNPTIKASVTLTTPLLGTPTSGNLANCTFPTLNQNTTGSAGTLTTTRAIYGNNFDGSVALTQIIVSTYGGTGNGFTKFSGPGTTEKTKTLRDATDTILELGGSYTPTGTWTSLTLVTPVLGTPISGNLANCTFPTLNQNTTGTANITGGTLGAIPYQSGANATTVLAASTTAARILLSGASAAPTWSTSTIPTSAGSTANKLLLSDGTNYVLSIPTFPNASATSRKITVSDGTNWVASTETYAVPGTSGNVLTSDGTNWTSAVPATPGTATNAINTGITDDTTTNASMYPTWVTAATGNLPQKVSSTKITFNPSTATLTTTAFVGALTGNASTASSAAILTTPRAINGTNFDGSAAITITSAAGTLTGIVLNSTVVTSSLTAVGTLVSGSIPYSLVTGTPTALPPSGSASGDLTGTYPGPTIKTSVTLTTPVIGAASGTSLVLSSFINEAKGADIASATTTDIGAATGNYINITGTVAIAGLGTIQAGTRRVVTFKGALTLTNNVAIVLPGGVSITTVAEDVAEFISLGSGNWKCTNYSPITITGTGSAVRATSPTFVTPLLGTPTSGTLTNCTGYTQANLPTIALTGNVTGSASGGSIATTIAAGVVTNTMLAGSISNANLANSSITVNGTAISLGASGTVTAAASTLTGTTLTSGVTISSLTSFGASIALGTPASGVLTNCSGTAASLTAGTVTTNANLTGPITSSGNATAIASQTGTGTKFVMDAAPVLSSVSTAAGAVTSIDGTQTLTNKRINKRVVTIATGTTFTATADVADICYTPNTQATGTLTMAAPTGTPVDGQDLEIRIKSTNVQTFAWNAIFVGCTTTALPTTTTGATKTDKLFFQYNSISIKWELLNSQKGYT